MRAARREVAQAPTSGLPSAVFGTFIGLSAPAHRNKPCRETALAWPNPPAPPSPGLIPPREGRTRSRPCRQSGGPCHVLEPIKVDGMPMPAPAVRLRGGLVVSIRGLRGPQRRREGLCFRCETSRPTFRTKRKWKVDRPKPSAHIQQMQSLQAPPGHRASLGAPTAPRFSSP